MSGEPRKLHQQSLHTGQIKVVSAVVCDSFNQIHHYVTLTKSFLDDNLTLANFSDHSFFKHNGHSLVPI